MKSTRRDDFLSASRDFANHTERSQKSINLYLNRIETSIAPEGRPSWPLATLLPFLWAPNSHMFLKPETTQDFSDRVGRNFSDTYSPKLNAQTYLSLLDMVDWVAQKIFTLAPTDRIDVQSFIWVVGNYTDKELKAIEVERSGQNSS